MPSAKTYTYRDLSDQLDDVLTQLQAENLDVDEALKLYEAGKKLAADLEKRLTKAEHTVRELKNETD